MTRRQKRQDELNAYVVDELKELRHLIQQANSDHARERKSLWDDIAELRDELNSGLEGVMNELRDEIRSLQRVINSRTEHLA